MPWTLPHEVGRDNYPAARKKWIAVGWSDPWEKALVSQRLSRFQSIQKIAPDTSGTGALFISCGPECKWEGGNFGTNDADRCQGKVFIVQISNGGKNFLRRFGERIFPAEVVLILEKLCFAYDRNRNAVPGAPGKSL